MIRKWLVFALSAGILVSIGLGAGLTRAQDEKEKELEAIMEQVQKHNVIITKGIRKEVNYKKSRADVEKSAKELIKLAKKAKPIKDALKNGKNEKDPAKKWDELFDSLIKHLEKFEGLVAKPETSFQEAKDAFKPVTTNCADCHTIFKDADDKF
jgi:cytochrome c556